MKIYDVAKVVHEVNRAYCEAIGDYSQKKWEEAPQWQRDSAISGVEFHIKNPDADPSQSHNEWLAQKISDGWSFGEVKNEELKQHPCMVSFEQLPIEQKVKDYLFKAVVESLLKHI